MERREMYGELTALIHAVAARLGMEPEAVAKAFESGQAGVDFVEDEDGHRAILVRCGEREAAVTPADLAIAVRALNDAAEQGQAGPDPAPPAEG